MSQNYKTLAGQLSSLLERVDAIEQREQELLTLPRAISDLAKMFASTQSAIREMLETFEKENRELMERFSDLRGAMHITPPEKAPLND